MKRVSWRGRLGPEHCRATDAAAIRGCLEGR